MKKKKKKKKTLCLCRREQQTRRDEEPFLCCTAGNLPFVQNTHQLGWSRAGSSVMVESTNTPHTEPAFDLCVTNPLTEGQ